MRAHPPERHRHKELVLGPRQPVPECSVEAGGTQRDESMAGPTTPRSGRRGSVEIIKQISDSELSDLQLSPGETQKTRSHGEAGKRQLAAKAALRPRRTPRNAEAWA